MANEFGKKVWEVTKPVIGIGVGFATAAVTEIICEAYAPSGTAPVVRKVMYKVGTKGLSMVTGAIAADAALEKLEKYELLVTEGLVKNEEPEEEVKAEAEEWIK